MGGSKIWIACSDCGYEGNTRGSAKEAAEAWNKLPRETARKDTLLDFIVKIIEFVNADDERVEDFVQAYSRGKYYENSDLPFRGLDRSEQEWADMIKERFPEICGEKKPC